MWPDRVSSPRLLALESDALTTALRGPARPMCTHMLNIFVHTIWFEVKEMIELSHYYYKWKTRNSILTKQSKYQAYAYYKPKYNSAVQIIYVKHTSAYFQFCVEI